MITVEKEAAIFESTPYIASEKNLSTKEQAHDAFTVHSWLVKGTY